MEPATPNKQASSRQRTRYSVRVQDGRRISEIAITIDLKKAEGLARRHHSQNNSLKTWVWNVRTGVTLYRPEREQGGGS